MLASGTYSKLVVPLALCLIGCSGEHGESEAQISMFTGRLETADSVVGVVVSAQGNVDAYVCGGATTFATHSRWFSGSLSPSVALLDADGFQLSVAPRQESATITLVAPDGTKHSIEALRADPGSRSALYESAADSTCHWGAVVMDDGGAEPNIFGTWCHRPSAVAPGEPEEIFAQVTPVKPIDLSRVVLPVLANTPTGEQRFELRRVDASNAGP